MICQSITLVRTALQCASASELLSSKETAKFVSKRLRLESWLIRSYYSLLYTITGKLYNGVDQIEERHRHRYEVNPEYVAELEKHGMRFVGHDKDKQRMEIIELDNHPYYVATQFHPEYLSRPLKPAPAFLGLILAAVGKLDSYLTTGQLRRQQLNNQNHQLLTCESSSDDDLQHQRRTRPLSTGGSPEKSKKGPSPTKQNGVTTSTMATETITNGNTA